MFSTRWKVLWNTAAQVVGRLIGTGTTFLVSLTLARAYGAEGYGDFAKITTYVALFYLLADFGMNAIYLQRHAPSAKEDALHNWQSSWGELLGVRIVGSILLMFLALAILVFLPQGIGQGYTGLVRLGIILFLPSIVFQAIITTTNAQFQQRLRYDLATIAIIAGSIVTIAGVVGVIGVLPHIGVTGAIGMIGVGAFVTAATAMVLMKKLGVKIELSVTKSIIRSYVTQSLPLGMTLVFNLIYVRADHVILALSRSTAEVGIYGLAYKVFEFPLAVPTFFMNSVYLLMLRAISDPSERFGTSKQEVISKTFLPLVKKSAAFLLLIAFLLSLVLWFASPLLSHIRGEFGQSIWVLRVLSLGLPLFFLTSLTMWALIALKRQTILAVIYGVSMVVNIILNVWFVPVYGVMAAAWITVASEALVLLVSGIVLLQYLRSNHIATISNS